ncbi:hypothetical protein K466DRAFT_32903 [Polyporus arcularius HHB13444]|uniref:Uncharacterized protein n=1 Tax=Polyporus arcularius HHB13444 TaxID=1314778 RepID=A0A5C3PIA7_9APHY|nr:hypothetical protein K466DRAFT_32903 [Polyporus arcularius HHB13444]
MCRWGEEQAQTFVRHGEGRPGGAGLIPAAFCSVHSHVEAAPPVRGVGLSSDVPARTATADVKADGVCIYLLCCRPAHLLGDGSRPPCARARDMGSTTIRMPMFPVLSAFHRRNAARGLERCRTARQTEELRGMQHDVVN